MLTSLAEEEEEPCLHLNSSKLNGDSQVEKQSTAARAFAFVQILKNIFLSLKPTILNCFFSSTGDFKMSWTTLPRF